MQPLLQRAAFMPRCLYQQTYECDAGKKCQAIHKHAISMVEVGTGKLFESAEHAEL